MGLVTILPNYWDYDALLRGRVNYIWLVNYETDLNRYCFINNRFLLFLFGYDLNFGLILMVYGFHMNIKEINLHLYFHFVNIKLMDLYQIAFHLS